MTESIEPLAYGQVWNRKTPNGNGVISIKIEGPIQNNIWWVRIMGGQHSGADCKFSEETIRNNFTKDPCNGL